MATVAVANPHFPDIRSSKSASSRIGRENVAVSIQPHSASLMLSHNSYFLVFLSTFTSSQVCAFIVYSDGLQLVILGNILTASLNETASWKSLKPPLFPTDQCTFLKTVGRALRHVLLHFISPWFEVHFKLKFQLVFLPVILNLCEIDIGTLVHGFMLNSQFYLLQYLCAHMR